jgi:Fe-S-cluster containining protein
MPGHPWYASGLRFECARSGNCCTGASGTVRVSEEEIEALARHLELTVEEFRQIYARMLRGGGVSLREKSNRQCTFFDKARGCTVYGNRPRQCRTWPFRRAVIESPERWAEEARHCPGMNKGPLYTAELIRRISHHDGTSGRSADSG